MTHDDLLAAAVRSAWDGPRPECLAPERLLPSELDALPAGERRRLEDHLRSCPACAAEAELAAAFELEGASARPRAAVAGKAPVVWLRGEPSRRRALAIAASIIIGLGSAVILRELSVDPRLPDRRAHDVTRGGFVDILAPRGDVPAAPARFEWTAVEGAAAYVVTVRGVDGAVMWSTRSDSTRAESPPELLSRLMMRVRYQWQVEAVDGAGAVVAASEPTDFVVRPAAAGDAAP